MAMEYTVYDRFELAAATGDHYRIVYKDDHGEHHAVMAIPKKWKTLAGVEWCFFISEAGEMLEVRLADILAIELPG